MGMVYSKIDDIITIQQSDNLMMLKRLLLLAKIPLNRFPDAIILRYLWKALEYEHFDIYNSRICLNNCGISLLSGK